MSNRALRFGFLIVVASSVAFAAVAIPRQDGVKQFLALRKVHQVLARQADTVVPQTLGRVVSTIEAFEAATTRLGTDPSEANMAATVAAWRMARQSWEESLPWMFGPGNYYDYHKQISAWPPDKRLIEHWLTEAEAGRVTIDARFLRTGKMATLRGLHTAEYLLFRAGAPRKAADLRPAELGYLRALSAALRVESVDYLAAWVGTAALSADQAALLAQAGLPSRPGFAAELRAPGQAGSRYLSASIAVQDIFQELSGVVEDACPVIAELRHLPHPADLYNESRSLPQDLAAQLQGVEAAYLGGSGPTRGGSVSDLVAQRDPVLDQRVRIALAHARDRLDAASKTASAPDSPEQARALAARVAEADCSRLLANLNSAALIVSMDPALAPWAAYGQ